MLESFVIRWGYLAIALGIFLEGESVLILGGALAHRGLLSLPWVVLVAFATALASDQLWFQMGRRYGRPLLERHPKWLARLGAVQARLQRYGDVFVFGFRFLYGLRTVTPVLLGMSDYPRVRFVCLNVAGVAIWSSAFGWAGWALGAAFQRIMDQAVHAQKLIAGALAAAFVVWLALRLLKRTRTP